MWIAVLLGALLLFIVAAHKWEPPEHKPIPRQPEPQQKKFENRAAVHEAGHTVAAWCCTQVHDLRSVTIELKEGGLTSFWSYDNDTPESRWCDIVINLAGLAAEIAAYGKFRGAECESDLNKARQQAKHLAAEGLLTPPWKAPKRRRKFSFDKVFHALDPNQARILAEAYDMAHQILEAYGNSFHRLVSMLLTRKTASATDLEAVLGPRAHVKLIGIPVAVGWVKPNFILPIVQA
jgi:ATP-dependent Zn protease